MKIKTCVPVIPSADLQKSLKFWVEGLGLTIEREMRDEDRLVGCMVHHEHTYFWLNQRAGTPVKPEDYEGIRLYWTPFDIHKTRERLKLLGYEVSDIENREYGQTEYVLIDDDVFHTVLE
jgi:hypothetical protein